MKQTTQFVLTIRHLKPEEIKKRMEEYMENLKKDYPHDATFGKYMKEN